jgi:hypothetical protein
MMLTGICRLFKMKRTSAQNTSCNEGSESLSTGLVDLTGGKHYPTKLDSTIAKSISENEALKAQSVDKFDCRTS